MHSTSPVPADQSVPGYRIALVIVGVAFTLTTLYTGSELVGELGLATAVRATLIGSLVLSVLSIPAAVVGSRTRLSTYMIVSQVFGRKGAVAVNVLLCAVLLGWYAVTAELFGRTCFITLGHYFPAVSEWEYTVACSACVIATTGIGFGAINRLSLLAAPLLVALTVYVAWRSLQHASWPQLMTIPGTQVDFAEGVSAVIGGAIVGVLLMPDITRYCGSLSDCVVVSVVGNGFGTAIALILSMLPALAFHEQDPMRYLATLHLIAVGFFILVMSTWTMNAINLYSAGLAASAALANTRYGRIVVLCGLAGTTLAMLGVADRLIKFLVLLGLIVPPVAAVYLTDYLVLRRQNYGSGGDIGTVATNVNGLLSCLLGAAFGIFMYEHHSSLTGVPTIESFLSACLVYLAAEGLRLRSGRDRTWSLPKSRARATV
jgi:cytosine permease